MINLQVVALALLSTLATCEPPIQRYNYRSPNYNTYNAQNTYLPPSTEYAAPSSSYLPPSTNYNGGFTNSHDDDGSYDHRHDHEHYDHSHDHGHGHDSEVPKSYEFGYSVKDAQSGNDYDRKESSDGNVVRGEYRVQLPDGRTQIVTYHADWQTGFHADVRYEGEAKYPEPTNNYNARKPSGYNYNAPSDFSGSLTGFHSNANTGYKTPSTAYGPPGYH